MATSKKTVSKTSKALSVSDSSQQPANVPSTTNFKGDVYSRLVRCRDAKGFLSDAELIRVAVVTFLEREGY